GLHLPETPVVKTGKGRHYYFRCPPGGSRNRVAIDGRKLDARGNGGYAVGAKSVHECGRVYEWMKYPDDVQIAPYPQQLLSRTTSAAASGGPGGQVVKVPVPEEHGIERFLARDLHRRCAELAKVTVGSRNDE